MLLDNHLLRHALALAVALGFLGGCTKTEEAKTTPPSRATTPSKATTPSRATTPADRPGVATRPGTNQPQPSGPPRDIKVQILSATTKNKTVAGAQVFFQKDGFSSVAATTDNQGKVTAVQRYGVDDATVSLIVRKKGFTPLVVACPCDGMSYAISKVIRKLESFRVVLNWGATPLDLDLHVAYPGNHIYFKKMKGKDAHLDVDDTTSYGPETITIGKRHPGEKYIFAVHDFSARGKHGWTTLAKSGAKVMVYVGQSLIRSYYVPPTKMGELWVLFGVDGNGAFTDINNVADVSETDKILPFLRQLTRRADWGAPVRTSRAASQRAKALTKKAKTALTGGKHRLAIKLYRKAIKADPNSIPAYRGLALAYKRLGQKAEAAWAGRKAKNLGNQPASKGFRVPNNKITLTASSVMGNWKHYTFGAKNLIDDNLWTSWQPKSRTRGGRGQWVKMKFSTPQKITGFEFSNGFRRIDRLGNLYLMNNRIKDAVLHLSDGTKLKIHFRDRAAEQTFMLPAPVTCTWVKLVVKTIYRGTKWNDLAVSEFHPLAK